MCLNVRVIKGLTVTSQFVYRKYRKQYLSIIFLWIIFSSIVYDVLRNQLPTLLAADDVMLQTHTQHRPTSVTVAHALMLITCRCIQVGCHQGCNILTSVTRRSHRAHGGRCNGATGAMPPPLQKKIGWGHKAFGPTNWPVHSLVLAL